MNKTLIQEVIFFPSFVDEKVGLLIMSFHLLCFMPLFALYLGLGLVQIM
jgi:hypothetical protein